MKFFWAEILGTEQPKSISELVRNLEVDAPYLTRILKLTILTPEIVESVINAKSPMGFRWPDKTQAFPEEWSEQRILFESGDIGA